MSLVFSRTWCIQTIDPPRASMILGGGGWGGWLPPRCVGAGAGAVLATKAGWGHGSHVFFGEAGFRVVSGLVTRRTRWLGLLTIGLVG